MSQQADTPPDFVTDEGERRKILSGLLLIIFLGALGQLVVAPVLPTLGAELGDVEHLPWIVTAYLLTAAVSTPVFGKLSDIHGRRRILVVALIVFIVGSTLCALAPSMVLLAVARGIQGLGGGAFIALCQAAIADIIPARERGRYQGHIVSAFAASTIAGPIVGGLLAEYTHWSLIFWLNLPLSLLALVMMDRAMRHLPVHTMDRRLDLIGAALLIFAILALLLGLSWGGVHYPWLSPPILGLAAASLGGVVAYVFYARRAPDPFLPLSVLKDRVVAPACIASFFAMVALIGLSAYMPMYFELVLGFSTSHASFAQTTLAVGTTAGGLTMGRLVAQMEQPKRLAMPLQLVAIACLLLLTFSIADLPLVAILALLVVIGFAFGTLFPLTTVSTQNAVDRRHLGVVMATLNLLRNIGGAVGSAVYGAILLGSAGGRHVASLEMLSPAALAHGYTILFGGVALAVLLALVSLAPMEHRPIR
jgi:EmrB/QacA subfamily drug resistance transporter